MARKPNPDFVKEVLCILYAMTRGKEGIRTHRHVQGEHIVRRFPRHKRGDAWKSLSLLESQGLIERKGGTESYWLTDKGWEKALQECVEE